MKHAQSSKRILESAAYRNALLARLRSLISRRPRRILYQDPVEQNKYNSQALEELYEITGQLIPFCKRQNTRGALLVAVDKLARVNRKHAVSLCKHIRREAGKAGLPDLRTEAAQKLTSLQNNKTPHIEAFKKSLGQLNQKSARKKPTRLEQRCVDEAQSAFAESPEDVLDLLERNFVQGHCQNTAMLSCFYDLLWKNFYDNIYRPLGNPDAAVKRLAKLVNATREFDAKAHEAQRDLDPRVRLRSLLERYVFHGGSKALQANLGLIRMVTERMGSGQDLLAACVQVAATVFFESKVLLYQDLLDIPAEERFGLLRDMRACVRKHVRSIHGWPNKYFAKAAYASIADFKGQPSKQLALAFWAQQADPSEPTYAEKVFDLAHRKMGIPFVDRDHPGQELSHPLICVVRANLDGISQKAWQLWRRRSQKEARANPQQIIELSTGKLCEKQKLNQNGDLTTEPIIRESTIGRGWGEAWKTAFRTIRKKTGPEAAFAAASRAAGKPGLREVASTVIVQLLDPKRGRRAPQLSPTQFMMHRAA